MKRLRNYLISGLLILMPIVLSIAILEGIVSFIDNFFIAEIAYRLLGTRHIPGLGVLVTLLLVLLVGALGSNLIGRRIIALGDYVLHRIPLFNMVYRTLKQIFSAFTLKDKTGFQRPVLVEYPRKGMWSIAFITGETEGEVQARTEEAVVNIFLPTTPNPTSGFLLMVSKKETIPLEMSVEDAVKMIISAGMVSPAYPYERGRKSGQGSDLFDG